MAEKKWVVSEFFEKDKLNIPQWCAEDRPREKLQQNGARSLTTAELLAILIGSGTPKETAVDLMKRVLGTCGGSLTALGRMSIDELMQFHGIGEAKAITILAACELGKRRQQEDALQRHDMSTAEEVYDFMRPLMQDLEEEQSWALYLNHAFKLIEYSQLSSGGLTDTAVDVRKLLKQALLCNATVVVLCHNHPSGNLRPSKADDRLTKDVNEACKTMRIHLADHIIVTDGGYYSYNENGRM